jgi:DUF2946 family protein
MTAEPDEPNAPLMVPMRAAPSPIRFAWAALFALLLALRLIGSAGYMPGVEHGRVTIIVCPGADVNAPLALGTADHHRGHGGHHHSTCPYAAAAALGAIGPDWTPLLAITVFAVALLIGRRFLFLERNATRDRPPAIGPPILA